MGTLVTSKKPRDPNALPPTISNAEAPTLLPDGVQADVVKPQAAIEETIDYGPNWGDDATMPLTAGQQPPRAVGTKVRYFGDYELLDEIARGGMGVVYKARQFSLNRVVALKMILAGQLAGNDDVQRFHAEAEAAANLDHPGIVPIYEVGEHKGMHYFSMALVDGGGLASKLEDGPLPPRLAAELTQKVALAIAFAHERGVIHRDLKPGNILLDRNGEPKVTDFGLAKKVQGGSELTTTGQILGTPSYMPPEQAAGKIAEIGPAADIYSLGAILYALLTGRPPFQSDNLLDTLLQVQQREPVAPRQLNPKVSADLETICLKCLEKAPGRRYAMAKALADELGRYLRGEPIFARPISTIDRGWRWCRRNPIVAGLTAGIAALLLIGTIIAAIAAFEFKSLATTERQTAEREREAKQEAEEASLAAAAAQKSAESERNAAQAANERALDSLAASLCQQAVAVRSSMQAGRRWAALDLLKAAEELRGRRREIANKPSAVPEGRAVVAQSMPTRLDLRTEAVAAMLTRDARLVWQRSWETASSQASFSVGSQRAAVAWNKPVIDVRDPTSGGVRIIDLRDGKDVPTPQNPRMLRNTGSVELSPDGKMVASPDAVGKEVGIWDVESGNALKTLKLPPDTPGISRLLFLSRPGFSGDGQFLAGVGAQFVVVWDVERGTARTIDTQRAARLSQVVAFSPNGKHFVHLIGDDRLALWDLRSDDKPRELALPLKWIECAAFSPDGVTLAVSGRTEVGSVSKIVLWNITRNAELSRGDKLELARPLTAIAFHADLRSSRSFEKWREAAETALRSGNSQAIRELPPPQITSGIACGDATGSIFLIDTVSGETAFRLESVHQGSVSQIACAPDGQRFWSSGADHTLKCWEPVNETVSSPWVYPSTYVAIHPQERQFAVVHAGSMVELVNSESRRVERRFEVKGPPEISRRRALYRCDGKQLTVFGRTVAIVWDLSTGNEVARWEANAGDELSSAAFTDGGDLVAAVNTDKKYTDAIGANTIVWNVSTGKEVWRSPQRSRQAHLSSNGKWAVLTPQPATKRLAMSVWDLETGNVLQELQGQDGDVGSVGEFPVISPDGHWLVAVGGQPISGELRRELGGGGPGVHVSIWSLPSGERRQTIRNAAVPTSYSFSFDSHFLAIGYRDGTAQLWKVDSGDLLFGWKEQSDAITQLAFSRDGSELVSHTSKAGSAKIMKLAHLRQQLASIGLDW
jgi:serine/threonine protein kinase/WD40 repeat protein